MRAMASSWNQGQLNFFITRSAICRDVAVKEVVWVYLIRTDFWLFVTFVPLQPSLTCLPFGSSVVPFSLRLLLRPTLI